MALSPFLIYVVPIVWPQLLGRLRQHPIDLIYTVCFLPNYFFSTPCHVNIFTFVGPEELGDMEHHGMDMRCYSCMFITRPYASLRNEKVYPAFSLFQKDLLFAHLNFDYFQ